MMIMMMLVVKLVRNGKRKKIMFTMMQHEKVFLILATLAKICLH